MNARLPKGADIVVIGGGVVGAASAFYLAEARAGRIVLLERGRVATAATSRAAGIVRALHDDAVETRLALRSLDEFARWTDRVGGSCRYTDTGFFLMFGERDIDSMNDRMAQWQPEGLNAELVSCDRIRDLYPQIDPRGLGGALYEPEGGSADPVESTLSYLSAAARLGVEVREGTRVMGIDTARGRVTGVTTAEGRIQCDNVIVASGVGACQLLPSIGVRIPLLPVRMTTGQIVVPEDLRVPITFIDSVTDTFYRPNRWPGVVNISMRDDRHNTTADPERAQDHEPVSLDAAVSGITRLSKRIPSISGARPFRAWSGIDGVTPDHHPVLGPVPGLEGVYLGVGGNFKSFKLAPGIGLALTDEILQLKHQIDLGPLSVGRFDDYDEMTQAPPSYTLRSVL